MSKPREFWVRAYNQYKEGWWNTLNCNIDLYEVGSIPEKTCLHVIEKSAADKLAEALEEIKYTPSGVLNYKELVRSRAESALKEYRGEE